MVKTGGRAASLDAALQEVGLVPSLNRPRAPRLEDLTEELRADVLDLYRSFGGTLADPPLRPGGWDLVYEGPVLVELDEELHFNRYRHATLQRRWSTALPWHATYDQLTAEMEPVCLKAGQWGKRWTNPSAEALLGPADPPGTFGSGGSPRWKQRALYDTMKDAAALSGSSFTLIRLSVFDDIDGIPLGLALGRQLPIDPVSLARLVEERGTR